MLKHYSILLFTIVFFLSDIFAATAQDADNQISDEIQSPQDNSSVTDLSRVDKLIQKMYFVTTDILTSENYESEGGDVSEEENNADDNELVQAMGDADEEGGFLGSLTVDNDVDSIFSSLEESVFDSKESDSYLEEVPLEEFNEESIEKYRVGPASEEVIKTGESVKIDGSDKKIKTENSAEDAVRQYPVKRPNKDFRNVRLPSLISKKKYNKDNSHLPPAMYESEYRKILFNSVLSERLDVMRAMIKRLDSTEVRDEEGNTPLIYAVIANKLSVTKVLVGMGAQINTSNYKGISPLYIAMKNNNKDLFDYLIAKGGDGGDINLLMLAIEENNSKIIESLINNNSFDVGLTLTNGDNLIHFAAKNNSADAIKLLIEAGVDLDGVNSGGYTPLMLAAVYGSIEAADVLIYENADLNVVDDRGNDAGRLADLKNHYIISAMIASGIANQGNKLVKKPVYSPVVEALVKIPIPVRKPLHLTQAPVVTEEAKKANAPANLPVPHFTIEEKLKL